MVSLGMREEKREEGQEVVNRKRRRGTEVAGEVRGEARGSGDWTRERKKSIPNKLTQSEQTEETTASQGT